MAESAADLKGLVETLVKPLVENPDALSVEESIEDGVAYVDITVDPTDAGKVIGRQGRVIKAIRTLSRAAGSRHGLDVEVELVEEDDE